MSNISKASIIIVNYNSGEMLKECVSSILSNTNEKEVEIIVVDNDSQDNSLQLAETTSENLIVIRNSCNAGFPIACNQGIKVASGEVIVLLNPDARIGPDTISTLIEGLVQQEFGISTIAQTDGLHRYVPCYSFPLFKEVLRRLLLRKSSTSPMVLVPQKSKHSWFNVVGYVSGACLAIRHSVIAKIGLMDENLFWIEDADWCKQAYDRGIRIGYCDEVTLFHHRSAIAKKHTKIALYYQYVSKVRFLHKYGRPWQVIVVKLLISILSICKGFSLLFFLSSGSIQTRERLQAYLAVGKELWLSKPAKWISEPDKKIGSVIR